MRGKKGKLCFWAWLNLYVTETGTSNNSLRLKIDFATFFMVSMLDFKSRGQDSSPHRALCFSLGQDLYYHILAAPMGQEVANPVL